MSTFLKKVASAFVVFEEDGSAGPESRSSGNQSLDDIARDASGLLAQLDGGRPRASATPPQVSRPRPAGSGSPPPPSRPGAPQKPGSTVPSGSSSTPPAPSGSAATGAATPDTTQPLSAMSADDVFVSAEVPDGANSSRRVLKMVAGLAMFPKEQQLVMVRAMDSADDTWSESEVVADALRRKQVLEDHLERVEADKQGQLRGLETRMAEARAQGQAVVDEVDKQIADLQKMRQEATQETASAAAQLESSQRNVVIQAEKAREGISQVIHSLDSLVSFFQHPGGTGR